MNREQHTSQESAHAAPHDNSRRSRPPRRRSPRRGRRWPFLAVAGVGVASLLGQAEAEFLQLHSPVDFDDVAYVFTLWNIPVGGGTVDLKECKWENIKMPWYATDAHHIVGMGITAKRCEQAIAATDPDQLMQMASLLTWYEESGEDMITWPWLISYDTDIEYGVDLTQYLAGGLSTYDLWQTFDFVDGVCPELPGFVVGDEVGWDDLSGGWRTLNGFTGELTVGGEGGLCPAPSSAVLLSLGWTMVLARRAG